MSRRKALESIWMLQMAAAAMGGSIHSQLRQERHRKEREETVFFFPEKCIKEGSIVGVKQAVRKMRDGLAGEYIMVINPKGFPVPYLMQCASKFASEMLCGASEKPKYCTYKLGGVVIKGYVIKCLSNITYESKC